MRLLQASGLFDDIVALRRTTGLYHYQTSPWAIRITYEKELVPQDISIILMHYDKN